MFINLKIDKSDVTVCRNTQGCSTYIGLLLVMTAKLSDSIFEAFMGVLGNHKRKNWQSCVDRSSKFVKLSRKAFILKVSVHLELRLCSTVKLSTMICLHPEFCNSIVILKI